MGNRLPPALRDTIKVGLAVLLATGIYTLGDLAADACLAHGIAVGHTVGAIALSYQPAAEAMRSFARRLVGTAGGMAIGIACWYLPFGGTVTDVVVATTLGWGFGILVDGTHTADKAAYFAGFTVLFPADSPLIDIASRSFAIALGFVAVLLVVTHVWPTSEPEERRRPLPWRSR